MQRFQRGACYFMLSFYDEDLRMPLIESYIFIGENLRSADVKGTETVWYFKRPDRFIATAYRLDSEDLPHCVRVGEDTVELVLDIHGLLKQLASVPSAKS